MKVFADNLFGTPDNIRQREVNGKITYLVGLGVKRSAPFSILQLAGPLPFVRALLSLLPANVIKPPFKKHNHSLTHFPFICSWSSAPFLLMG